MVTELVHVSLVHVSLQNFAEAMLQMYGWGRQLPRRAHHASHVALTLHLHSHRIFAGLHLSAVTV